MRRLGLAVAALVVTAAAASALSCDPRKFDDLADRTWYRHIDHPGQITGDFGVRAGGVAIADGMLVVALAPPRGLVILRYDADGGLADTLALEPPPPLLATDTVRDFADLGGGRLALGTSDNIIVYADASALTGATPVFQTPPAGVIGVGGRIAAGDVDGDGTTDLVTISDNAMLTFIPNADGTLARTCTIDDGLGGGGTLHSLTVGDWDSAAPGDEVALALGSGALTGVAVVNAAFFQNGTCVIDLITGGTGVLFQREAPFTPQHIVMANWDGMGQTDLVISAPQAMGIIVDATSMPSGFAPPVEADPTTFGAALAAGDFDGDPDGLDEILIGNPSDVVDETADAGKVYVAKSGLPLGTMEELYDTIPEDNQLVGRALGVATLGGQPVLVVGANLELLIYFKVMAGGDDPRFDDQ